MAGLADLLKNNGATDQGQQNPPLTTKREPRMKARDGEPGSVGAMAFQDACIMVAVAWLILIFLSFSLRNHNV